jgi:hypothetical protein
VQDLNPQEKECFGRLEKVFPRGENGLRASPEECIACAGKTACLRAALSGESGDQVRAEKLDRAYRAGAIGFVERWSRRKSLQRRRQRGWRFSLAGILRRLRGDG